MTKPISDYTMDELSAKIEAIKAERERTANALKKYEEELERRNNQNWLPINNDVYFEVKFIRSDFDELCVETTMRSGFVNRDCFKKYLASLTDIHKAWSSNAKGEQIDIQVLLPLLPKGWVAMDKSNVWHWYKEKPYISKYYFCWSTGHQISFIGGFNLKPAENWKNSLMECGL